MSSHPCTSSGGLSEQMNRLPSSIGMERQAIRMTEIRRAAYQSVHGSIAPYFAFAYPLLS